MAHVGEERALRLIGVVREFLFPAQRVALFRLPPHPEQVCPGREENQQQQADGTKQTLVDLRDVAGHHRPGDIAHHGAVRFRQVRDEQEAGLPVDLHGGRRRPMRHKLLAEGRKGLLDGRIGEKRLFFFTVILIRHDEMSRVVVKQEVDAGMVGRQAETVGQHRVAVSPVQDGADILPVPDGNGEKQPVPAGVIHHVLPAERMGQPQKAPAGDIGPRESFALH